MNVFELVMIKILIDGNITFKNREQFLGSELSFMYATLLLLNDSGMQSVS